MNESWKQAEADAHEAKAIAIDLALGACAGVVDILDPLAGRYVVQAMRAMQHEKDKHDKAATLARAKVPA